MTFFMENSAPSDIRAHSMRLHRYLASPHETIDFEIHTLFLYHFVI